jgi:Zn-dependent protease with chaperone function
MKRTILMFIISALVVATLALWVFKGRVAGNTQELIMVGTALVIVGFAVYVGMSRLRSHRLREPAEDELSKKVMTRASSLAYYISIYLWLFVMYVSDKTTLPTHSLIGIGILGMAVVFLLCWLGVRFFGTKNV